MARAGDTIENPLSGERIRFDETGAETGGRHFSGSITLAPHGHGPPEHVHPVIEERFRVESGTLSASVAGVLGRYGAGDEIVVPPGVTHRWWNDTAEPVEIRFHVAPALPLDRFLEDVFALARAGLADERGVPRPLRMAPVLRRHWDVVHLASPPLPIQKIAMAVLSVVSRALRYPTSYEYPYDEQAGA